MKNSVQIKFSINSANQLQILTHLHACNNSFDPPLDNRVNLEEYSVKLHQKAVNFEAFNEGVLIGLIAAYFNDLTNQIGYITNVSLIPQFMGLGIASTLMKMCTTEAKEQGLKKIRLEVVQTNQPAIKLYHKFKFEKISLKGDFQVMEHIVIQ